jgi:hypothetical protein
MLLAAKTDKAIKSKLSCDRLFQVMVKYGKLLLEALAMRFTTD